MGPITDEEAKAIERRIADVEGRTGVQIVTAVVARADLYPELPWRAFALGASLAGLIALAIDIGRPDWLSAQALLMQTLAILGGGAVAGLIATRATSFAKLFLGAERAKAEVRQCAESLFLTRELFATPRRDAVLILVSQFEHRVVIVPDVYCRGRVTTSEWEAVVAQMTPKLREGHTADALLAGLGAIEALLTGKGLAATERADARTNVLPDTLVRGEAP
jgi:putative membrane protein